MINRGLAQGREGMLSWNPRNYDAVGSLREIEEFEVIIHPSTWIHIIIHAYDNLSFSFTDRLSTAKTLDNIQH